MALVLVFTACSNSAKDDAATPAAGPKTSGGIPAEPDAQGPGAPGSSTSRRTCGHSTYSSAAAEVLAEFFPEDAPEFRSKAQEAALSRLYGGIHYATDNDVGMEVGTKIGQLVAAQVDEP